LALVGKAIEALSAAMAIKHSHPVPPRVFSRAFFSRARREGDPSAPRRSSELSVSLSLAFGIGTVGVSCMLNPISMYFPAMLATVLGLSPAIAGMLLTGSKLYDVIADIAIGAASDRTRSRWGRRRPYMFVGGLVGAGAMALIFNPWLLPQGTALIVCLAILLVIYSTGYSLFNIPYIAMPAEMTDDVSSRTVLISWRSFFIAVGQLVSVAGGAQLISLFGGGTRGYGVMGLALALIIVCTTQITVVFTGKARRQERVETAVPVRPLAHLRLVLSNRPFVLLMSAKLFLLFGQAATASTQLLFLLNVVHVGYAGQVWFSIAENIALAGSLVLWVRAINRWGKRPVYILGLLAQCLLYLAWLMPGVEETAYTLAARGFLRGVFSAGILLAGTAMLPDTMQFDTYRTGLRREGMFASVYAIVEKIAFAVAPALIGGFLAFGGYIPTTGGAIVAQPASATAALYVLLVGVPIGANLTAAALIWFYPLDGAMLDKARVAALAPPETPST
jgi:GPH family glycoside/pentoside/hexuronide:cation symporter